MGDDDGRGGSGGGRRLLKRGCGCGLLLAAVVVALLFLAPTLSGGLVGSAVEGGFAERYRGSLELPSTALAWRAEQRIEGARLLDPDGGEVATVSVTLPSLLDLARVASRISSDERCELGTILVELDAEVVVDEDGVSNLGRALEPREEAAPPPVPEGEQPGVEEPPDDSLARLLETLGLRIELRCRGLRYRDLRLGADAPPLALRDVNAVLALQPGQPIALEVEGQHDFGVPGPLQLQARVEEPRSGADGFEFRTASASLVVGALPYEALDALAGLDGELVELGRRLGEELTLELDVKSGVEGDQELGFELGLGTLRANGAGRLADGVLSSPADRPAMSLTARLPGGLVDRMARPYLPAGARLEAPEKGLDVELSLVQLAFPLEADDPLQATSFEGSLTLGPLAYVEPEGGAGARLALHRTELSAALPLEGLPNARLACALDERGEARASAALSLSGGRSALAQLDDPAALVLDLELAADGFATELVDRWLGQEGLLREVLGPRLALRIGGAGVSRDGGRLNARFESLNASLDWSGVLRDGVLTSASEGDRLEARLGLTPLLNERVLGPLLPMLVGLSRPADAAPMTFSVRDFVLPLDGDLGSLRANLGLELGAISYRLLPGLADVLPNRDVLTLRSSLLPPLQVQIAGGRASYAELPLEIDGRPYRLGGSYDLVKRELDLQGSVPLANLGGSVGRELEKWKEFLDPNLGVPVRIEGGLTSPRIRIETDFLEKAAKDAAQQAIEKGLEGELEKGLRKLFGGGD